MEKTFTLDYNVSGSERKRLVNAVAQYTQIKPKYLGAPSFAYEVDCYTIGSDGQIAFDIAVPKDDVRCLINFLAEAGFTADTTAFMAEFPEWDPEEENAPTDGTVGLTVQVLRDQVSIPNLTSLLEAKGALIKKALGITATPIEVDDTVVCFPWFEDGLHPDEVKAYTHFIGALCKMSTDLKRVVSKEKAVDNDKYAFRCFLLRLGFIGNEYKAERKILLRNLTGSSAFKSGARKETADDVSE